jgi:hypothetical protein
MHCFLCGPYHIREKQEFFPRTSFYETRWISALQEFCNTVNHIIEDFSEFTLLNLNKIVCILYLCVTKCHAIIKCLSIHMHSVIHLWNNWRDFNWIQGLLQGQLYLLLGSTIICTKGVLILDHIRTILSLLYGKVKLNFIIFLKKDLLTQNEWYLTNHRAY